MLRKSNRLTPALNHHLRIPAFLRRTRPPLLGDLGSKIDSSLYANLNLK